MRDDADYAEPVRNGAEPDWRGEAEAGESRGDGWAMPVAMIGAGSLMVLCCLAPLLLAGGALGALAGFWARLDPLWIVALAIAGAAAFGFWRSRRTDPADCCEARLSDEG